MRAKTILYIALIILAQSCKNIDYEKNKEYLLARTNRTGETGFEIH